MDHRFQANVRKIRFQQNVHDSPCLIGSVPNQITPDGAAHTAARTVTADDIARLNGFSLCRQAIRRMGHRYRQRVFGGIVSG